MIIEAALSLFLTLSPANDAVDDFWNHPVIQRCCSIADATLSDDYKIFSDGAALVTVTRGTERTASWAPIGQTFHVPADKIVSVPGNPLGAALLFLRPHNLEVLCFVTGPMI